MTCSTNDSRPSQDKDDYTYTMISLLKSHCNRRILNQSTILIPHPDPPPCPGSYTKLKLFDPYTARLDQPQTGWDESTSNELLHPVRLDVPNKASASGILSGFARSAERRLVLSLSNRIIPILVEDSCGLCLFCT